MNLHSATTVSNYEDIFVDSICFSLEMYKLGVPRIAPRITLKETDD